MHISNTAWVFLHLWRNISELDFSKHIAYCVSSAAQLFLIYNKNEFILGLLKFGGIKLNFNFFGKHVVSEINYRFCNLPTNLFKEMICTVCNCLAIGQALGWIVCFSSTEHELIVLRFAVFSQVCGTSF